MKLSIECFRGLAKSEIDLNKVTLVAGVNAAGKTSAALAAQAAASGDATPLEGLKAADAGLLVRAGTMQGRVVLEADAGRTVVTYPKGEVRTEGTPLAASRIALGLDSITTMKPREREATLVAYLKTLPTGDELKAACVAAGLSEKVAATVVQQVADTDWDSAAAHAQRKGAEFKGRWQEVTAETWGSDKGAQWYPKDWETDLQGASEQELRQALADEEAYRDGVVATQAVYDAERERLEGLAAREPALAAALDAADQACAKATQSKQAAADAYKLLPAPGAEQETHPCPHCQKPLVVEAGKPVAPRAVDKDENERRAAARRTAVAEGQKLAAFEREALKTLNTAQAAHTEAGTAKKKLEELQAPTAAGGDINEANERVRRAKSRLDAFLAKSRADQHHRSITMNAAVQKLLKPEGLRRTKARAALRSFNEELTAHTSTARWGMVQVNDEFELTYERRPFSLLSGSEKYRVHVTLQVALAARDRDGAGSGLIVIDGADILDKPGRNGLMRLAATACAPVLIGMTLLSKELVPNLGKIGGSSYWIEYNRTTKL